MPAELIQMPKAELFPVIARPHPFSMETYRAEFPVGSNIRDMVGDGRACRVEIGGMTIPEEMWANVRPKAHIAVVITRYPEGGSSVKSIFRIIAFAALAVGVALISGGAAAGLANFLPGLYTAGSVSAGLLAAGVGLVGALLINALIPPQTPSTGTTGQTTDTLQSITGTSNQITPFGTIPCVLGTVLMYPPYAAKPYTELLGDDQYLRCLFDLGYGDPLPADMRIGDTDITSYTDVETEVGTTPSLFSQDIEEVAANVVLNTDGDTGTRSSASNASEVSIDLSWASGLVGLDAGGNPVAVTCSVKVEFSPAGAGTWSTLIASTPGLTVSNESCVGNGDGTFHVTNAARKAVRVGLRWNVSVGQYDVRVTRVSTDWGSSDADARVGDMTWTVIRAIRTGSVSTTGTKKIALRIKANDQLNGNIDQFNCTVSQQVPVWHSDTSTWVTEVSDNPAWIFRYLLKDCPANPRLVDGSRIDDDELKAWALENEAKEFGFDSSIDQATTMFALLKDVAAAGRATLNIRDGKYSVVRDVSGLTPIQVFTPRNSWGFSGTRAFADSVHAMRMQFINPEASWQQDERIVYKDGYGPVAGSGVLAATNFETMQIRGCTNANAAWRLGRYYMAVGDLRPNTYSWNTDIEHIVCNRGDLVHFASDVIGTGLAWGRVKETVLNSDGNAIAVVLDELVTPQSGTTYGLRIRKQNGSIALTQVSFDHLGEPTNYIKLNTPQSGINADDQIQDLALFGVLNQDTLILKISKIEPGDDISAKLTAVDAADAVLTADAGDVPAWTSQITGQPWIDAPEPPSLVSVSSSQILSNSDDGGITQPVMIVAVTGPWFGASNSGHPMVDHIDVRYRTSDPVGPWTVMTLPTRQFTTTISAITRDFGYDIEARAVAASGAASTWTSEEHHSDTADLTPDMPTGLAAAAQGANILTSWNPVPQADVQYELQAQDFAAGIVFPDGWGTIATGQFLQWISYLPPGGRCVFRVRAVAYSGAASAYTDYIIYDG